MLSVHDNCFDCKNITHTVNDAFLTIDLLFSILLQCNNCRYVHRQLLDNTSLLTSLLPTRLDPHCTGSQTLPIR